MEEKITVVPSKTAIRITRWLATLATIFFLAAFSEDISKGFTNLSKQEILYSVIAGLCPFAALYLWRFGSRMREFYFQVCGEDYEYYWETGNLKNIFRKQIIEKRKGKISELKIGLIRKGKPIYVAVNGVRYLKIDQYAYNREKLGIIFNQSKFRS